MHPRLPYKLRQTQEIIKRKQVDMEWWQNKRLNHQWTTCLRVAVPFPPQRKRGGGGGGRGQGTRLLSPIQTNATLLTNNSQHCWMLHVASVCAPCCMLLDVVACCCAKFETGQTFRYVQADVTTPSSGKYLDADSQTDLHTFNWQKLTAFFFWRSFQKFS